MDELYYMNYISLKLLTLFTWGWYGFVLAVFKSFRTDFFFTQHYIAEINPYFV